MEGQRGLSRPYYGRDVPPLDTFPQRCRDTFVIAKLSSLFLSLSFSRSELSVAVTENVPLSKWNVPGIPSPQRRNFSGTRIIDWPRAWTLCVATALTSADDRIRSCWFFGHVSMERPRKFVSNVGGKYYFKNLDSNFSQQKFKAICNRTIFIEENRTSILLKKMSGNCRRTSPRRRPLIFKLIDKGITTETSENAGSPSEYPALMRDPL